MFSSCKFLCAIDWHFTDFSTKVVFLPNSSWNISVEDWDSLFVCCRRVSTLHITVLQVEPYVVVDRADHNNRSTIIRYRGYIPDLLQELSTLLDFRYQLSIVPDDKYGHRTKSATTKWTGMIGELQSGVSTQLSTQHTRFTMKWNEQVYNERLLNHWIARSRVIGKKAVIDSNFSIALH